MRFICFVLLFSGFGFSFQESEYQSNLIILKDGRMVAIRGDFEIIGDEVQFMYADGNLSTLPLDKVDLDATRVKQEELEKKIKENAAKAKPRNETIYDDIRNYQSEQEAKEKAAGGGQASEKKPEKPRVVLEKKEKRPKQPFDLKSNPLNQITQEQVEQKLEEVVQTLQDLPSTQKWVLFGIILLLGISALASLVVRIYLIWTAKFTNIFWALGLLLTTTAPIISALLNAVLPGESVFLMLLGLFLLALQLLEPILYTIYILIYCTGKRLFLLFLYFAPLMVAIGLVAALLIFGVPLPV